MPPTPKSNEETICNELQEELFSEEGTIQVVSDEELESYDKGYLVGHNQQYSKLLETYVANAKKALEEKCLYKRVFFWGCMIALAMMLLVFFIALGVTVLKENTIQIVVELVSITVSLASAIIVVPKIIAEYLFNTSDEANMVEIIKNMQEYDKSVRENIRK